MELEATLWSERENMAARLCGSSRVHCRHPSAGPPSSCTTTRMSEAMTFKKTTKSL